MCAGNLDRNLKFMSLKGNFCISLLFKFKMTIVIFSTTFLDFIMQATDFEHIA